MKPPSIDFADVARRADLRALLDSDLGPAKVIGRVPHWPCPFHGDRNPSLYLYDHGRRWRCWPCNLTGDALDYLVRRENIDVVEAARRLDPTLAEGGPARVRGPKPPRPDPRPTGPEPRGEAWQDPAWQEAAGAIVRRAERDLWGRAGREALGWLTARGLADDVIRRLRLGFVPAAVQLGGIRCPRGITLPWVHPESWYAADGPAPRWVGVNVRRLMPDVAEEWTGGGKCRALQGSTRGYPYPHADPSPGRVCLLCEGEFDALLAYQEIGHLVNVLTVGGAGQAPHRSALVALALCPWWLVASDHDAAGVGDALKWRMIGPHKARRALLPIGKDVGEFVRAGGDLRGWIAGELARLRAG